MKYMLMMNAPRGTGDYAVSNWSSAELKAHVAFMHSINKELKSSGELVGAEGLASPGEAKLVRAGRNGQPATDGVFPETKEYLAGFRIVDVESARTRSRRGYPPRPAPAASRSSSRSRCAR